MNRSANLPFILFTLWLFVFWGGPVFAGDLSALDMNYTLKSDQIIGEGSRLLTYDLRIGKNATTARIVVVDLLNPHVEIQAMHPREGFNNKQSATAMAAEQGAVAAVNADFFHLNRPAAPFGLHVENSMILSSPAHNDTWIGFGIDENKTAHILNWWFNGEITCNGEYRHELYGYNQTYRRGNHIFLYDRSWGREVSAVFFEEPVLQVTVQNGLVTRMVTSEEAAPVPEKGYVLVAEGTGADFLQEYAPPGSSVEYSLGVIPDMNLDTSVGGHILVVDNGRPVDPGRLTSPGSARAARTAVGIDSDGKTVYFVTVDSSSLLGGVTMEELSVFLSSLGMDRALNLDGGGSTTMVARHLGEFHPVLINRPSLGPQRALPNAIGIFNRAPKTSADKLFLHGQKGLLLGADTTYRVTGHDRHFHPLHIAPSDLNWNVSEPELADVADGTLKALKRGEVRLTVSYQGITEEKTVFIYGGEDIASISVTPEEIRLLPGQRIPLQVDVETKDGLRLKPGPASVSWEADIGFVEDHTYVAVEEGFGTLTAMIDGHKKEIPLRIGGKKEPFFTFQEWQTTAFRSHPAGLPGSFEMETDPVYVYRGERSGRLEYDFTKQEDGVMIAYGQLGSGQISMSQYVLGISAYVHGDNSRYWLRAEFFDAGGTRRYVDLAKEVDWTGWKQVQGTVDPAWPQPLILSSIYLVQMPEMRTGEYPETGRIYIDHVEMIKGLEAGDEKALVEDKPRKDIHFSDIAGHWGEGSVMDLAKAGILRGYEDGTIRPDRTVTRAEYLALLQRVFWQDEAPAGDGGNPFYDTIPPWAEDAVALAVEKGVVRGYEDGTFRPQNPITRAELAAMTNLVLKAKESSEPPGNTTQEADDRLDTVFNDSEQIPSWAREHVFALYEQKLVQGYAGSFHPASNATRAEAAAILWKIMKHSH